MLKVADLRKTTRRSGEGDLRAVYPRFLRDRTLEPRIELAIRYLEKMLGHARRELDAEVIVGLFGDHKLAHCMLACLASSYRHRARTFAEVLPAEAVASLAAGGITSPSELRLALFRRANQRYPGFIGAIERAPFLAGIGEELGLAAEQIERLIALDEPSQAVLVRTGPVPTAQDVRAIYNYAVAAALLANAPLVRIALSRSARDAASVRALCARLGVRASLSARELVLYGQQDALQSWARHGMKLVRVLSWLLACGLPARSAEALVAAPQGGQWRFRLDAEILGYLGARADAAFAVADLLAAIQRQEALAAEFNALRREDEHQGWTLRRAGEPLIVAGNAVPALFVAIRGSVRVSLVPAPAGDGVACLAQVAERQPMAILRLGESASRRQIEAVPELVYAHRGDLAALPALLEEAAAGAERTATAARLEALFDEARAAGVLTEAGLAEWLGCTEEEVAERLAAPELDAALDAARAHSGLHYVEGFGLCTGTVLMRARAAAADVANLRERADGAARVARVLGRRLREVTGASTGIECLIAYLGAA
jgi:hypothetical protein